MRFLILSCNTGEGHNSAARAIADSFNEQNIECEILDALAFWSPNKSKVISDGHVLLYKKFPKLFGVGYRFEENHPPKDGNASIMYDIVTKGCKGLKKHLEENEYDGVICTHIFGAMMITELKKRNLTNIKCHFVYTDYTCYPGVSEILCDTHFIAHEKLKEEFIANGTSKESLCASGIPVRKSFYNKIDAAEAKKQLNLPEDKKIVLLTCGSMGCGPIKYITENLPEQLDDNSLLIVICGNNRKLYKSLTKYPLPKNIKVLGYTTKMALYMDAADLILTKPGGLSTTEAAIKALPIIFIDAVPGCETKNIDFFVNNNFADIRKTASELCDLVCDYMKNPDRLKTISDNLSSNFSGCASDIIRDYILKEMVTTI